MTREAAVQVAWIPLDPAATLAKAEGLKAKGATDSAGLAVFPDALNACDPNATAYGAVVGRRAGPRWNLYQRRFDSAVQLEAREVGRLISASTEEAAPRRVSAAHAQVLGRFVDLVLGQAQGPR